MKNQVSPLFECDNETLEYFISDIHYHSIERNMDFFGKLCACVCQLVFSTIQTMYQFGQPFLPLEEVKDRERPQVKG